MTDLRSLIARLSDDLEAVSENPAAAAALALSSDPEAAAAAAARTSRGSSRFAARDADADVIAALAGGGSATGAKGLRVAEPSRSKPVATLAGAMQKAMAEGTNTAGGYLVPTEVSSDVYRALKANSAVLSMPGIRFVPVKKELAFHALSSSPTAQYVAENAALPVSEPTVAEDTVIRPKAVGALVPVSNRLLRDTAANPDLDSLLREELAEVLSLRIDLAFLSGVGSATSPTGITNVAGTNPGLSLGANGAFITLPQLRAIAALPRQSNATYRNPGWIFNPALLSHIEAMTDSDGRFLADNPSILSYDESGSGGRLFGYPFRTTTQISTTQVTGTNSDTTALVFHPSWETVIVGEEQPLSIDTSTEASYTPDAGVTWISAYQNRQSLFRVEATNDLGLRRPGLCVVQRGIRV